MRPPRCTAAPGETKRNSSIQFVLSTTVHCRSPSLRRQSQRRNDRQSGHVNYGLRRGRLTNWWQTRTAPARSQRKHNVAFGLLTPLQKHDERADKPWRRIAPAPLPHCSGTSSAKQSGKTDLPFSSLSSLPYTLSHTTNNTGSVPRRRLERDAVGIAYIPAFPAIFV